MFWATNAYAMGGAGGGGAEAGLLNGLLPIALMFAVFYFLLIRPQQKRAKEHQSMLGNLKRGDEVITAGGLYGRIIEAAEHYLVIDLGDTKVKVTRSAVSSVTGQSKASDKLSKKAENKEAAKEAAKETAKEAGKESGTSDDSTK